MRAGMLRHPPRRVKPQLDEGGGRFCAPKMERYGKGMEQKPEGRRCLRFAHPLRRVVRAVREIAVLQWGTELTRAIQPDKPGFTVSGLGSFPESCRGEILKSGANRRLLFFWGKKGIINLPPVSADVRKMIDVQTDCMFLDGSRSRSSVPGGRLLPFRY